MNSKKIIDALQWLLIAALLGWVGYFYYKLDKKRIQIEELEKIERTNTTYQKIYESQELVSLKKTNKELYDSIARLQDVKSALIVKYRYRYVTDTVMVAQHTQPSDSLYHYESDNDTVRYCIDISAQRLNWHKASFTIDDKFTIVNRERDGQVTTTVSHSPNAEVVELPSYYKKQGFFDHFHYGPSVGVGYGVFTNRVDVYVGFSASYQF